MLIAMICAFGYHFLTDELERKAMAIGEQCLWRLCSQASEQAGQINSGSPAGATFLTIASRDGACNLPIFNYDSNRAKN